MRTGIYVDFENISYNGLGGIQFKALRRHYEGAGPVIQAHSYMAYDEPQERERPPFGAFRRGCRARLTDAGFNLQLKEPKVYQSSEGEMTSKANFDVDIAVDVMLHCERLDRVVLMSGDGDFVRLVKVLQDKGIHVEVAAHTGLSGELAKACSSLFNPMLIPDIFYNPDVKFKFIFKVNGFDRREMQMEVEYLVAAPRSLSPEDPAWRREKIRVTREMFESRRFTPGKILGWTGAEGIEAFHDLA